MYNYACTVALSSHCFQVRYENDPESAIVQFCTPQDAKRAHNATEAVLNNRFIKVYYLKNTGTHPFNTGSGQKENVIGTSIVSA